MNKTRKIAALTAALAAALAAAFGAAVSMAAPAPSGPAPDWHTTVREFAATYFKNPAWGYSHCQRDYALAKELAAADHVALDDDVLFAAAYLHDIGAFALGKTRASITPMSGRASSTRS